MDDMLGDGTMSWMRDAWQGSSRRRLIASMSLSLRLVPQMSYAPRTARRHPASTATFQYSPLPKACLTSSNSLRRPFHCHAACWDTGALHTVNRSLGQPHPAVRLDGFMSREYLAVVIGLGPSQLPLDAGCID
jgi:hypothetical protein